MFIIIFVEIIDSFKNRLLIPLMMIIIQLAACKDSSKTKLIEVRIRQLPAVALHN